MIGTLRSTSSRRLLLTVSSLIILLSCILYYLLVFDIRPLADASCHSYHEANNSITVALVNWCEISLFFLDLTPEILKALIGSALTAGFFLAVWHFVRTEEDRLTDVEVLDRPACKDRHQKVLDQTEFWFHNGHLANWVRSNVLPAFRKRAREMATLTVHALIIDPRDDSACASYLNHIQHLPPSERQSTTLDDVRVELCATILSFFYEHSRSPNLTLLLSLKDQLDYIRKDINSLCAFLTIIGPDTPGIVINKRSDNSMFYNIEKANFLAFTKQRATIDFEECRSLLDCPVAYEPECAMAALKRMLGDVDFLSEDIVARALAKVHQIDPS